jgi:hypothetical protein
MDLVRTLLMALAADQNLNATKWIRYEPKDLGVPDKSDEEVGYHIGLLTDAGFIKGGPVGFELIPPVLQLTWDGHEFLDNIRDQDIWAKTKRRLMGLPSVGLRIVAQIAEAEIRQKLGLP